MGNTCAIKNLPIGRLHAGLIAYCQRQQNGTIAHAVNMLMHGLTYTVSCPLSDYFQTDPRLIALIFRGAPYAACRSHPLRKHVGFVIERIGVASPVQLFKRQGHAPYLARDQFWKLRRSLVKAPIGATLAGRRPRNINSRWYACRQRGNDLGFKGPAIGSQPDQARHSEHDARNAILVIGRKLISQTLLDSYDCQQNAQYSRPDGNQDTRGSRYSQ